MKFQISELGKLGGFLAAGLPAFFIAIPLNFALVQYLEISKPLAYGIVLVFQVTMNFFMCRWLVFKPGDHKSMKRQFAEFMAAILGFRIADWVLYTVLVEYFAFYYLGVQVFNVLFFSLLKYRLSKKIIEGK